MDLVLQLDARSILNYTKEIQVVGSMVQQVLCASGERRAVLEAVGLTIDSEWCPHRAHLLSHRRDAVHTGSRADLWS
jgi:hypothetical protein